ncbi:MAG TPA: glycine betaine ABC transporter substrate-binding protein [bacterium]|nr:glycine betaine ABC transporter substrate-binding protein [bacterium]
MKRHCRGHRLLAMCVLGLMALLAAVGPRPVAEAAGPIHLTVGGKLDTEAQLLTKMYVLLLRHAGFAVTEKAKLGTNDIVFSAITSRQIDLYPEFTATGLARLGLKTTHNEQQDYALVKSGFENRYHITWLEMAPLNDTYGICSTQARAGQLHATKVSDLAAAAPSLTVATPPDGRTDPNVLPGVKRVYGFAFGKVTVLDEALTFTAVQEGRADANVCYTTNALIAKDRFVLLDDDRHLFPIYHPAPIVREDTLRRAPGISAALNALAPKLTTTVSQQLQLEVVNGESVTQAATDWLKSMGLL